MGDKEKQYDKIMKISMYMTEHYAEDLWEEFGFERTGDLMKDIMAMDKIFEEIYKRENEKYPKPYYEYCCVLGSEEDQNG